MLRLCFLHFLFKLLMEMMGARLVMMLPFVGAGRSLLGIRVRDRRGD